ncbi:ABC transporter permease [Beijerinckia indica]|uniref:Binding-protein-dependent transport systems inner membrane component n=1 Tax=Beijerinckia indica subsp. indica (strain ATCC 9039 / DSM 1715 / NCIMB 8712) TaxID=395963 RepID=B2IFC0_BEII9|nr:ABC transporter permease subunit [Beijerinckia indica]ACB97020.1 binding-protein-dependent transport systems inner membrane component [Beijerinckia indica subsp. indica ATCC 9039]
MIRFVLNRLLAAIPTLLIIAALSFFLMRLAPGGPFDGERALDPAIAANLRRIYRLDLSLPNQFMLYLESLMRGDFGPSLHWRDFTVNELFAKALPVSLRLGGAALILAFGLGLPLGLIAAAGPRTLVARFAGVFMLLALVIPPFVVAPLLQLAFGLDLKILPVGGWEEGAWRHQILPVLTLSLPLTAAIAGLTRAAMRDHLAEPHIRTLRAFGLPAKTIYGHALRGALVPVVAYLGLAAANVLTGSMVVETIFGLPGMGRYFVDAALGRDYTVVMGAVIIVACLVVGFNLLADLIAAWLDPRISHE